MNIDMAIVCATPDVYGEKLKKKKSKWYCHWSLVLFMFIARTCLSRFIMVNAGSRKIVSKNVSLDIGQIQLLKLLRQSIVCCAIAGCILF